MLPETQGHPWKIFTCCFKGIYFTSFTIDHLGLAWLVQITTLNPIRWGLHCFYKSRCETKKPNKVSQIFEEVHSPKAPGRQHLHSQKENSSSYPQCFRVQAVPFRFWVTGAFILDKKIHHFPIDLFTWWVLLPNRTMRFRFTISKKKTPQQFVLRIYFFGNKLNFFPPKKSCIVLSNHPFGSLHLNWIIEGFPRSPMGNFGRRCWKAGPEIHFFGNQPNGFYAATQVILLAFKRGREVVVVGERLVKVGVVVFFNIQYLAGWKLLFISIKCDFLLVNDCFFLVDLSVRNFGRME